MDPGPRYRGVICRLTLEGVRRRPTAEAIVARVPAASISKIESCRSSSWVSTCVYDDVVEALRAVEGLEGIRDFFRSQSDHWSESQLFRPLMLSAQRIFGLTPYGQLKWLGRAWHITTRGMGTVQSVKSGDGICLSTSGLPPSHRIPRMVAALEGSITGVVLSYGRTPEIAIDDSGLDDGAVTYEVRWS